MTDFLGRLRTPRLTSAPSAPVKGEMYMDTATDRLYWWNGTAWVAASGSVVTAGDFSAGPPGSPTNGDIWQAVGGSGGEVWTFRYQAASASAYKWEFIGGSEVVVGSISSILLASLVSDGGGWNGDPTLQLTTARAGDYVFFANAEIQVTGSSGVSFAIGQRTPSVVIPISYLRGGGNIVTNPEQVSVRGRHNGCTAGATFRIYVSGGALYSMEARSFGAYPVRVS